jgi:hypothetical protein
VEGSVAKSEEFNKRIHHCVPNRTPSTALVTGDKISRAASFGNLRKENQAIAG